MWEDKGPSGSSGADEPSVAHRLPLSSLSLLSPICVGLASPACRFTPHLEQSRKQGMKFLKPQQAIELAAKQPVALLVDLQLNDAGHHGRLKALTGMTQSQDQDSSRCKPLRRTQ